MLLPLQPLAQALAAMLKRAEPPICVGLYARWGSGKTFMISLLKKEFDPDVREEPRTRRLLQFFEEGYDDLGSTEQEPTDESITYLICYLLINILLSLLLIPRAIWLSLPYGVTTFFSILCDAFDVRKVIWAWCSRSKRVYWNTKAKIRPYKEVSTRDDELPVAAPSSATHSAEAAQPQAKETVKPKRWQFVTRLCKELSWVQEQKKEMKKEYIFVDFNAWECAVCVHVITVWHTLADISVAHIWHTRLFILYFSQVR